jgi:hypothetical protein
MQRQLYAREGLWKEYIARSPRTGGMPELRCRLAGPRRYGISSTYGLSLRDAQRSALSRDTPRRIGVNSP